MFQISSARKKSLTNVIEIYYEYFILEKVITKKMTAPTLVIEVSSKKISFIKVTLYTFYLFRGNFTNI